MTKQETIQVLQSIEDRAIDFPNMTECDWVAIAAAKRHLTEESVSEDLEEASKEWLSPQLDKSYANYGEAKMMELTHFDGYAMLDAIEFGAKWQKENLWKHADGDDLPEIDREVVAFQEIFPTDVDVPSLLKIVIAHRPNTEGYDGKSITTGQVEHYTPKTYDKGGWNIPDVKYWLDYDINELLCREK